MVFSRHASVLVASLLVSTSFLGGCASTIPATPREDRAPSDPWEPMNRRIYTFNDNLDRVTFKPAARAYEAILPRPIRSGIGNFFENLKAPLHIVNNLLQFKLKDSVIETTRFVANSTVGLGGLLDVGSDIGLDSQPEDFGQTLAVWGVPDGPYVVLPVFGPKTLRDSLALPLDYAADPLLYYEFDRERYALLALRTVDLRADLFTAEALIEDSYDRYLTLRESYLQNRRFVIYDGEPPVDEDFYDDFEDFEDFDEE